MVSHRHPGGLQIMELTECQERRLDQIQRVIGRMLLGHASDSPPSPVVLEELAWGRWSTRLIGERARLLERILASGELSEVIVAESGNRATSWLAKAAEGIASWCGGKMPEGGTEWKRCLKIWKEEWEAGESEWRETRIMGHQGLASYRCRGDRETRPGVNSALHDKAVGAEQARAVARLLAGGQGLRGGDPVQEESATVENCCFWCLSHLLARGLGKR